MKKTQNTTKIKPIRRMLKNAYVQNKNVFTRCAIYTVPTVVLPFLSVLLPKVLIDELTGSGIISPTPTVKAVMLIVAAYFLLGATLEFVKTYVNSTTSIKLTELRLEYIRLQGKKLLEMDYPYCEDSTFFERYDRALASTSSNNNGVEGIYHKLFELPSLILTALLLSAFVGRLSPFILGAMLLNLAATVFVAIIAQKYRYSRETELGKCRRRVYYYAKTTEDFEYGKDIRLYGLKQRILDNFNLEMKAFVNIQTVIKNREFMWGIISLLTLLVSDAVTYGMLVYYVVNGMPISDFSMYLVAVTMLSTGMAALSENITFVREERMYVNDMYKFIDEDLGEKGGALDKVPDTEALDIEFSHVTFAYPGTDKKVLNDFCLHIPKYQRLALVGVNGAGKTTLVKLLCGLYPVDSGEIRINGKNVNEYNKRALHSMFSVVFQDVNLLAFSVAENVACKSENIDYARVDEALKKVGLYDKIHSFENGTDQILLKVIDENGVMLSGGEAQKLMIARALYKKSSMVIMDEPTAALDALAEADIYAEFAELTKGKTALYISHRLASTKFCDMIALVSGDGLLEYGTHDELLEKRGVYYDMFMTQGKYYREGTN